jgi:ArsR family transcriptional regulator
MLKLDAAAQGFAAVGSEPRLAVLLTLVRAGIDGLTVGDIQERVGLPASTLAHHLRHLGDGGLIEQQRQGRAVVNRAAYDRIKELADYLLKECCSEAEQSSSSRRAAS